MTLAIILLGAAVLCWLLQRAWSASGIGWPFLSICCTCGWIIAGLMAGRSLHELALGVMLVLLAAFSLRRRESE